jgi:hypothetical protein
LPSEASRVRSKARGGRVLFSLNGGPTPRWEVTSKDPGKQGVDDVLVLYPLRFGEPVPMSTLTSTSPSPAATSRPDAGVLGASDHADTLRIVSWPDPVIDTLGHDPRSWYVEQFWLPVIGPTSTWLLRRIVARFDSDPGGFDLDLDDTARGLGLGGREGRHSPFQRALGRCVTFQLARSHGPRSLAVRRRIPPLSRRHLDRLPPTLQELHAEWSRGQIRTGAPARTQAPRHRSRPPRRGAPARPVEDPSGYGP